MGWYNTDSLTKIKVIENVSLYDLNNKVVRFSNHYIKKQVHIVYSLVDCVVEDSSAVSQAQINISCTRNSPSSGCVQVKCSWGSNVSKNTIVNILLIEGDDIV